MTTLEFKHNDQPEGWEGNWRGGPPADATWPQVVPIVKAVDGGQIGWASCVSLDPPTYESDIEIDISCTSQEFVHSDEAGGMVFAKVMILESAPG